VARNGGEFLVMQYLDGETLADRLARGALKIDEALAIPSRVAAALATAHRHGVIHRDPNQTMCC
jgi:eukaryotic-like serine/threonine-protein kinase